MFLKRLFGFVPVFKYDVSQHRKYTYLYEDLCQ